MTADANVLLKIKVQEQIYTIDRLTLGDWRILKTEFGLDVPDIFIEYKNADGEEQQAINFGDPNVLVGLLTIALHHERPKAPIKNLIAEVEEVGMDEFEFVADEEKSEDATVDPPVEVPDDDASEATVKPAKGGSSAKRQKKPGIQD